MPVVAGRVLSWADVITVAVLTLTSVFSVAILFFFKAVPHDAACVASELPKTGTQSSFCSGDTMAVRKEPQDIIHFHFVIISAIIYKICEDPEDES